MSLSSSSVNSVDSDPVSWSMLTQNAVVQTFPANEHPQVLQSSFQLSPSFLVFPLTSVHVTLLQSSFQLSPTVRATPCSSNPQLAFSLVFISPMPGCRVVSFSVTVWREVHRTTPLLQVHTLLLPSSSHRAPSSWIVPLLSLHVFFSGSTNPRTLPQSFFVQPGTPDGRHLHLLHSSCQLSPDLRATPCSSTPHPDFA